MKYLLLFFLVPLLIGCCNQPPKSACFYSDGKLVRDTTHLLHISRELERIRDSIDLPANGLRIYTSLQSGGNEEIRQTVIELQDRIYTQLKWRRPEDKHLMDSLRKRNRMLDVAVIVMENKTGRELLHYASWARIEKDCATHPDMIGSLSKTLLFTLAMQQEYSPDSLYPQTRFGEGYGPLHLPYPYRSFYNAFGRKYASGFPYGLEERYLFAHEVLLRRQLNLPIDDLMDTYTPFDIPLSLTDLAKVWSCFSTNGIVHEPTVIDRITTMDGSCFTNVKRNPNARWIRKQRTK